MRLAGYQPQYFPRLHYIARMLHSDIFAIADHVQFVRAHTYPAAQGKGKRGKSYQADTPIKSSQGLQYLTVPIRHTGAFLPINEIGVSYDQPWPTQHLESLRINYARSRHFPVLFSGLSELLMQPYETLAELNIMTILWAIAWILSGTTGHLPALTLPSINARLAQPHPFRLRKIVVKSAAGIAPPDDTRDATEWIIETCQMFRADEYYFGGTAAAAYIDGARFKKAGIRLLQQNWIGQPYTQLFPKLGFIPNLSILDLLANEDQPRIYQILHS